MSSVSTQSRYDASRHIFYISTAPFNSNFFLYTYTQPSPANNFVGSGALSAVLNTSGNAVSAAECPAGRILRTNGKKLYPDAAALSLTAYPDRTPLIGVFDYHSGFSGYIDPNATMFALYNVDKPIDSLSGTAASGANNHKGMSVYTGGSVTAGTGITLNSGFFGEYRQVVTNATTATGSVQLTVTDPTLTTYCVGVIFKVAPASGNTVTLTMATIATLYTLFGGSGATAGVSFKFSCVNTGAGTVTVSAGSSETVYGLATVATGTSGTFIVRLDDATPAAPTVGIYRV